ncbi:hypothetical protein PG996_005263 [Apiospora saccharicola]|uniref:Uncharacterized protein n=1 Tax=Apiospora saccharicola TaxID=335842 RepID=A0ABR1VNX8_9PEZI
MSQPILDTIRDQKLLDSILQKTFKSTDWFTEAVKLGANPVFLGFGLTDMVNGYDGPIEVALMSMEWTGDLSSQALLKCLRPSERFDEEHAEYSPEGSNITLNIWESLRRDDATKLTSFDKLFRHQSNTLKTAILYYNNGKGHYEELEVAHQLPWGKQYTVELARCRNVYNDKKHLEWTFCLYNGYRSVDGK